MCILVSQLTRLKEHLNEVTSTVEGPKRIAATIKDVTENVDAVKHVLVAVAEWKRYPFLTWMAQNKPKEMRIITASVIAR